MAIRNFRELLRNREEQGLRVCIGLDPIWSKLPLSLQHGTFDKPGNAFFPFNRDIVMATHDLALAYKLDLGFYMAEYSTGGLQALKDTVAFIKTFAPKVLVILDGKFGGAIAIANERWAKYAFGDVEADAVTIHWSTGRDAFEPFLKHELKGIFVLGRTSDPGAREFQDLQIHPPKSGNWTYTEPLYQHIAKTVAQDWNRRGNCGLVVAATSPGKLAVVRHLAGNNIPLLIPAIGAQGGDLEAAVKAGTNRWGRSFIISSSRGIAGTYPGPDFAEAARNATQKLHDQIHTVLAAKKEASS